MLDIIAIIQDQEQKHVTGHAASGKESLMRLMELFSQPDNKDPRLNPDINYLDDLKFFVDNNSEMLSNIFFPAVKEQQKSNNPEEAFKLYIKPLKFAVEKYCEQYDLKDVKDEIFTDENLSEIAKRFATEQHNHINNKDYE